MAYRQSIGRLGEDLACAYLQRQGWQILTRNWRCARGEVDIIAREGECLVFVEVKTRRGHGAEYPEDGMTAAKRRRLAELAGYYLAELEGPLMDWRIDLVAIELDPATGQSRCSLYRAVGAG
ncbi:MAG: YraN family protein [Anaerolineae bacterium]|jgi:putative endonuclease|nr:YraN family protein [Chloroflexota bacterium]